MLSYALLNWYRNSPRCREVPATTSKQGQCRRCQPGAEWRAETPSGLFFATEACSHEGDMTGKDEATPDRLVGAEQQATTQGDAKPAGITKPKIVAGSGRGGLSG